MEKSFRKPGLTIEQVKRMKSGLAQVIEKFVMEFQTETGVMVDIKVDRRMSVGCEPCDYPVEIIITGAF